jgi:hypothetical protein
VTSFLAIPHYSPLLVLATGLATFVGLWGVGVAVLHFACLRLPSPWDHVTAVLLGIQALSLTVQIAGMTEIASPLVLCTIWWIVVANGVLALLFRARPIRIGLWPKCYGLALLPIAIIGVASATNVLVALAPSTKIDELYCYMLIPSRIVSDGALRFYREPWVGAIWPHMVYQISAAPVHAIGYPDATNVVSWALSITLLWFAWRIMRANANTVLWTALCVASLCVGLYPAVWYVTGGAHAMGDLALAAAVVAFCNRERLLVLLPPPAYAALFSILVLSASTSKVSLLPVSAILLCFALWPVLKSVPVLMRPRVAVAVFLPWLVFYLPIAGWAWIQSGSPFGPILAGLFGSSVYSISSLEQTFQLEREMWLPLIIIRNAALGYSPLIWLGAVAVLFVPALAGATRVILASLLAMQCLLIYWFMPSDVRYLSLHFGLFIVFVSLGPRAIQERLASVRLAFAACVIFLLPWLAIQVYYAKQFFLVSNGLEKDAFYQRNVAFYSDFVQLDRILSRDTVLLVPGFTVSAAYAPRPIFFDPADLPPGQPVAMLTLQDTVHVGAPWNGYTIGDEVYENPQAVIRAYRTPGRAPIVGRLKVVRLLTK